MSEDLVCRQHGGPASSLTSTHVKLDEEPGQLHREKSIFVRIVLERTTDDDRVDMLQLGFGRVFSLVEDVV